MDLVISTVVAAIADFAIMAVLVALIYAWWLK